MKDFLHRLQRRFSTEQPFGLALSIGIFATLTPLALFGYLGIFSRYESDDYCLSAFFFQGDLISSMIQRYFVSSSRYTNILFIGLADKLLGWYNVAILPALMLSLFVFGLYLLLKESSEAIGLRWSRAAILFISVLVVYFSVTQAPDLYETLYWRAGMTSHFAPVVFIPFWGAFLIRQIRDSEECTPSLWTQALCFMIPFLIGGLSEPPTALMITILSLSVVAAWRWGDVRNRGSILILLLWSLAGAMTALIVMALAPANSLRMQTAPPGLFELVSRIVYYPFYFIVDTLRTLPVPTLMSMAVTALLFYVQYPSQGLSREARNRLGILMILILMFAYLFIAASFAPSVYGQSYPVPRARFIARMVMTGALIAEGALLGILLAQAGIKSFQTPIYRQLAIVVFMLLALYPLRTAWRIYGEIPVYQQRAAAWDARDAEIRALKDQGVQDLVVRFLSEIPIQDLGDRTGFRLNRCAATIYGVNSIVAVPMGK
jgi:hypothetical protein